MLYEFSCPSCKTSGGDKVHEVARRMQEAGNPYICPDCQSVCERIYSFQRTKEFMAYQDAQYGCEITSAKQEKRLMKKHGHVYTRETPAYDKFREQRRLARKKPVYFSMSGVSSMKRD